MPPCERQTPLALVLHAAVDAILFVDSSGRIEVVNSAAERMFGYTEQEFVGRHVTMLISSPFHARPSDKRPDFIDTGEPLSIDVNREVIGIRKDGTTLPLHLTVRQLHTGEKASYIGFIRDISELKNAQHALQQLNATLDERVRQQAAELHRAQIELAEKERLATLGRISGGIAHEIRNPLNAIKTSAYYLLNACATPEETHDHLTRIDRQVTMIEGVVTALSELAKLPPPITTPCNLGEMIDELIRHKQLPKEIKIERDFPDNLPDALADAKQIPIIFSNLIRNACDAMPTGGVLTLSASTDGNRVVVFVRDTGTGIAPETLSRINEPFFSTKARGMGLGLAITKAILEKNHSTIDVETKLGVGTTFSVSFPCSSSSTLVNESCQ